MVLVLELPPGNDQAAQCQAPHEGFSLSLLPALSLNHKGPTKRSYFSPQEYRPASKQAPDTEETRKNDEQKIQERQEIKINAGQRH